MSCRKWTWLLVGTYVIACAANFEAFFWGDHPRGVEQVASTAFYVLASLNYLVVTRKQNTCVLFSAYAGVGLAVSGVFAVLARNAFDILSVPGALLAVVFVCPLYAVRNIISDWDVFYIVLMMAGGLWSVVHFVIYKWNGRNTVVSKRNNI